MVSDEPSGVSDNIKTKTAKKRARRTIAELYPFNTWRLKMRETLGQR